MCYIFEPKIACAIAFCKVRISPKFKMKLTILFQQELLGMFDESDTKREVHEYCCSPSLPSKNSAAAIITAIDDKHWNINTLVIIV